MGDVGSVFAELRVNQVTEVCLAAGQLDERQSSNLLPGGRAQSGGR